MCGASDCGSLTQEEGKGDIVFEDSDYIPEPFPEQLMEPLEWTQILATLDVCINEVTPTRFCDKNGLDITPLCMIKAIKPSKELETDKDPIDKLEQSIQCLRIYEEISIRDLDIDDNLTKSINSFQKDHNPQELDLDCNFWDALGDLHFSANDEKSKGSLDSEEDQESFLEFPNTKPRQ